jgi:spermidine/putrescine transport system substrate-binding protein
MSINSTTIYPLSILKTHLRVASTAVALLLATGNLAHARDLNALIWCDHADPALLQPFEDANGVKVNVKEFKAPAPAWRSSSSRSPATGT